MAIEVIIVNDPISFGVLDSDAGVIHEADGSIKLYPQLTEEPYELERV